MLSPKLAAMNRSPLDRIVIVLVGTLYSGNIGSVARAMNNMGLSRLRLVQPQCAIDRQATMMATHGSDILNDTVTFSTLNEAIADAGFVYGTSARQRQRRADVSPSGIAGNAIARAGATTVAFVFGPEDRGLTNAELEACHEVITIPTSSGAASLNIAHAVLIISYELFQASFSAQSETTLALAENRSLQDMYGHMRRALLDIGYLNPGNPDIVLGYFKRILSRSGLSEHEVRTMRGIFRQLQWFIRHSRTHTAKRFDKGPKDL